MIKKQTTPAPANIHNDGIVIESRLNVPDTNATTADAPAMQNITSSTSLYVIANLNPDALYLRQESLLSFRDADSIKNTTAMHIRLGIQDDSSIPI
jgi:hypothetical protein